MTINTRYEDATGCRTGPQPGVKAFMSWYLGAYKSVSNPEAANLGIFVCKRLGSGWSLHAEGRAADCGTEPYKRPGTWMWALLNQLRLKSKELGIQLIIHERRIWSASYPDAGWREHNGSDPHNGHAHIEFNWWAAQSLTAGRIESVLHDRPAPTDPKPQVPSTDWTERLIMALPTVKRGAKGTNAGRVQGLLHANGYRSSKIDNDFGPKTEADVKRFQERKKTKNSVSGGEGDGIVGRFTWADLLGE